MTKIKLVRVYAQDQPDGYRILVDRLWPRGKSKSMLHLYVAKRNCSSGQQKSKSRIHTCLISYKDYKKDIKNECRLLYPKSRYSNRCFLTNVLLMQTHTLMITYYKLH